jgi:hypothetical protein
MQFLPIVLIRIVQRRVIHPRAAEVHAEGVVVVFPDLRYGISLTLNL